MKESIVDDELDMKILFEQRFRREIREHAIEILDGGKEAFEKRKNKYKI